MAVPKISLTNPQEPDCDVMIVPEEEEEKKEQPQQQPSSPLGLLESSDSFEGVTCCTTSSISSCGSDLESTGSSSKPYYHHSSNSKRGSLSLLSSSSSPLLLSHSCNYHNHQHHRYASNKRRKQKPNRTLLYLRNQILYNNNNNNNNHNNQHYKTKSRFHHRSYYYNLPALIVSFVLVVLTIQRLLSLYFTHRRWINAPITYMHRTCPVPPYELLFPPTTTLVEEQSLRLQPSSRSSLSSISETTSDASSAISSSSSSLLSASSVTTTAQLRSLTRNERVVVTSSNTEPTSSVSVHSSSLKICITSLTDQKSPSLLQRIMRWRNFDGIMKLTRPNKIAYAQKYGYHVYDGSDHYDKSRPPAWSKIRAIQALFSPQRNNDTTNQNNKNNNNGNDEAPCDWVLWMDADTVIMNSDIRIEDFLPADPNKDLIVVSDKGGGYNSGVLLFRNSQWSHDFLDEWWNMNDFVRPPGLSLSGDNAALKALLRTMEERHTFHDHIVTPPRCTMNSFAHFLTLGESLEIMDHLTEQEWYYDNEHYHKGDFIAHIPGFDNKAECLKLLLREAR